jgi:hypothetical protein
LAPGGDAGGGEVSGAGGGNAALVQGDGFGSFAAGAGVLLLGGLWVIMATVS